MWNISFFLLKLLSQNYKCGGYVPCCVTVNTHTIVNWKHSVKCYWRLLAHNQHDVIWRLSVWNVEIRRYLASCMLQLWSNLSRIFFFVNVWRKHIFDIYVTEYGTALTTILPTLFLYLNTVTVTAGTVEP